MGNAKFLAISVSLLVFSYNTLFASTLPMPQISAGGHHSIALKSIGTIYTWGGNWDGQLGDGSTTEQNTPVYVDGLSNVISIAGGYLHSVALKSDGTVWAWGNNTYGQLGDDSTADHTTPTKIDGISDVSAIASGYYHTIALKSDGTVWAWGDNSFGQLGNGTNTNSSTPVNVSGLNNVISIAGGYWHSIALKSNGSVWTWGNNIHGQLGDGTNTDSSTPVQVLQGPINIIAVSGGYYHTAALTSDGAVWTWGDNYYGQLGNSTNDDSNVPTQMVEIIDDVPIPIGDVIAIACGGGHTICLRTDGSVWTCGSNYDGQLGNGDNTDSNKPVLVSSISGIVTAIAGGLWHTIAMGSDGTVWTWGSNYNGQLGDGTHDRRNTPVQIEDFNLAQTTSKIYGYVVDSNGQYIDTAKLKLRGKKTKKSKITYSDTSGYFEFTDLEADTYTITSKKKGYDDEKNTVILEVGDTKKIEIEMQIKEQ